MALAMIGICVPTFVMGPLLILSFSLELEWFNASGWNSVKDRILPALTLGGAYAAYIARLTRGGMLEVLSQDYIRTAHAKGASPAGLSCITAYVAVFCPWLLFSVQLLRGCWLAPLWLRPSFKSWLRAAFCGGGI